MKIRKRITPLSWGDQLIYKVDNHEGEKSADWQSGYMSDPKIIKENLRQKLTVKLMKTLKSYTHHVDPVQYWNNIPHFEYISGTNYYNSWIKHNAVAVEYLDEYDDEDRKMIVQEHCKYPELYTGMLDMMISIDDIGNPIWGAETFKVSNLRKFVYEKRVKCAGAQLLVYKYDCYLPLVHSSTPIHYLAGVKSHPFVQVKDLTMEESDICECCPPPSDLIEMNLTSLRKHLTTKKHVCTKWDVDPKDAVQEMHRLKTLLRLSDYPVRRFK